MKKYDKYKDSGIEWLGEIPEHWECTNIKYMLSSTFSGIWGDEKKDDINDVICIRIADFNYMDGNVSCEKLTIRNFDTSQIKGKILNYGDLLLEKSGGGEVTPVGRVVRNTIKDKATCSNFIQALKVKDNYSANYLYYLFYTMYAKKVNILFYNQTIGIQNLKVNEYLGQKVYIPSKNEQAIIASYLDDKVSKIDAAIAEKESMIEDLQNYRKSVITKAVTHGLNPDVPMKDSGVDKFNEIPTHWEESKLKYIASINSGTSLSSEKLTKEGMYEVYGGNGCIGLTSEYNTKAPAIIIGRVGALCGNVHLIDSPKWVTDNALVLTLKKNFSYKFISYFLKAYDLNTLNSSNAQPLITGSIVLDVVIPLPKCKEQEEIVKYLDTIISNIEFCISKTKSQIEDLKAYKSSVITEAVTGKIDLR